MTSNNRRSGSLGEPGRLSRQLWQTIRRAFVEFLAIPTTVIAGFLLLAVVTFLIDEARMQDGPAAKPGEWRGLFSDAQATREFIAVIAGSIITVTSITLSLLLIAVQQGASALTTQVFDQFLRRRTNQFYFGFFIGLALYSLIVLASINPSHQPTYGVALAGVLTAVALYALILLVYTTIDEMRPVVILRSIHDHALRARQGQLDLLRQTRRMPRAPGSARRVAADHSGFFTRLNVAAIAKAADAAGGEVVILVSIGDYVAFGDPIAEIVCPPAQDAALLESTILRSVALEEQRDLDTDPAYGVEQLAIIGWTSISTAKSNPDPGLLAIRNLRDLLARWLQTDAAFGAPDERAYEPASPVVYPDNVADCLMRAFESLAVVASESMQHQSAAEIYRTFASQFHRLPPPLKAQADDLLLRSLSGLGDHMLTSELDAALSALRAALTAEGASPCAAAIEAAQERLKQSIGRLHSRDTRA